VIGDEGPEIAFDLHMEFYLENREDPVLALMEIEAPALYIKEIGVAGFMEHCLEDFMAEANQKSSPFIIMRSSGGMRQVFWERAIQAVSLHAPDFDRIETLIEEALNGV